MIAADSYRTGISCLFERLLVDAGTRTISLLLLRPLTSKWIRARYLAERHELEQRYREWEIIGPPEIRYMTDSKPAHYNVGGETGAGKGRQPLSVPQR